MAAATAAECRTLRETYWSQLKYAITLWMDLYMIFRYSGHQSPRFTLLTSYQIVCYKSKEYISDSSGHDMSVFRGTC